MKAVRDGATEGVPWGNRTVVDGSSDADLAVEAAADQVGPVGVVHVVTAFHPEAHAQLIQHLQQLPEEFRYVNDHHAAEKERQHAALARLQGRGVDCAGHVVQHDPATAPG